VNEDEWWSLTDLNGEAPDHDHYSTVDNLAGIYYASEELRCFHKEHVSVAEIQKWQLHDDPADVDGDIKIEDIRRTIRSGNGLPAIVLAHTPEGRGPFFRQSEYGVGFYHLLEGQHRYNAAYREQETLIYAWVAHIGCCGGPEADVEDGPAGV
jgi:hypothetical protein